MSCEVFCSEIFEVLQVLVEGADGKHFAQLFSFLDLEPPLDHHLAGYFEKVAELLFRRMTVPVMRFVNTQGMTLLKSFLRHMDNYSILQIVQRLLLPHIPFSIATDPESINPNEAQNYQCDWSYSEETCVLLCAGMLELGNIDIPSHISDLLITVLQLSPADALILSHLCQQKCVEPIIAAAIVDDADTTSPGSPPTPVQCVSLAAISVLESMVLRLGESAAPFPDEAREITLEEQQMILQIRDSLESFLVILQPFLSKINTQLERYAANQPCGTIQGQTKNTYPRLGHRGLQLVKFVESLVRLSNPAFDVHLCESGVIRSATNLIFIYDLNSILHLSIQRIALMVIEGGAPRRLIQQHLLVDCGLLKRIMDRIDRQIEESTASANPNSYVRVPALGHLIHIVQSMHHNFQNESFDASARQDEEELMGKLSAISLQTAENEGGDAANENAAPPSEAAENRETSLSAVVTLHTILEGGGLLDTWQNFVQSLVKHLESQAAFNVEGELESNGVNQQMEMAMHALGLQRLQNEINGGNWSKVRHSTLLMLCAFTCK